MFDRILMSRSTWKQFYSANIGFSWQRSIEILAGWRIIVLDSEYFWHGST